MRFRPCPMMLAAGAPAPPPPPPPPPPPGVSAVSSATASEGSAVVHTVTLSAAPSSPATFSISLGGGAATAGVDYTSTLTNGSFSAGVTISGGAITVPAGVASFTVTVSTTDDASYEGAETYILTVGGVSGVGTINDNDVPPDYGTALEERPLPTGSASFTADPFGWDAVDGVDGYVIVLSPDSKQFRDPALYEYMLVVPGAGVTSINPTGIAAGTYYCRIATYTGDTIGFLGGEITKTAA